ncbi:PA2169 family four-helix-bundle protein [bacterium]|nr:PA2169 family four-helix-bundle protein [bacterium]
MSDLSPDAVELQTVLTRYVDSHDGYLQAAEVVQWPGLAAVFLEIAARRNRIIERVAAMIAQQGGAVDLEGSTEAAIHRWWMRVRAEMTREDFNSTLAECLRGENELSRTLQDAIQNGKLDPEHSETLVEVDSEVKAAISTLESTIQK